MSKSNATATWTGTFKAGSGTMKPATATEIPFSAGTRFEDQPGSNPEEMIGAALAGCFSMALSNILGEDSIVPDKIETRSTIFLSMEDGPKVVRAHLDVKLSAQADEATLKAAAEKAEKGCPISQLLDCEITMDLDIL